MKSIKKNFVKLISRVFWHGFFFNFLARAVPKLYFHVILPQFILGTALEFMRFSELFMYAMRLMFARSVAEVPSVRAANLYEFPFGFNYGWMLLIFALTVAYGVVCPLITPFGLFYLVMKHGVDRYNLYYAYKRSKINKNIHATGNFEFHEKRKLINSRPRKLVKMNDIFSLFSYSCKLRHCQSSYPTINFVVF